MADGGDATSGAPAAEGEGVEALQGDISIPSITSTVSGLPISPVYAGAGMVLRPPRQMVFHASRLTNNKMQAPVMKHEYVPQHRGALPSQKTMEGTGELFTDPMDNFKEQPFKESSQSGTGVEEQKSKENPNKYRNAGKKAYKSDNKDNKESSARRQLRYSQE